MLKKNSVSNGAYKCCSKFYFCPRQTFLHDDPNEFSYHSIFFLVSKISSENLWTRRSYFSLDLSSLKLNWKWTILDEFKQDFDVNNCLQYSVLGQVAHEQARAKSNFNLFPFSLVDSSHNNPFPIITKRSPHLDSVILCSHYTTMKLMWRERLKKTLEFIERS